MKTKLSNTLLKTSVLVLIFAALPIKLAIPVCIFTIWVYQYIIALLFGVRKFPTMDMATFYGLEKANTNIMSVIFIDRK